MCKMLSLLLCVTLAAAEVKPVVTPSKLTGLVSKTEGRLREPVHDFFVPLGSSHLPAGNQYELIFVDASLEAVVAKHTGRWLTVRGLVGWRGHKRVLFVLSVHPQEKP